MAKSGATAKQGKKNSAKGGRAAIAALELRTADGTSVRTFSGEAVAEFRHMVSRLARDGGPPEKVAVTAALREEGTTTMALALGSTIATDMGLSVCVAELNWHWPGMLPSGSAYPGIAAALAGECSLDAALVATEIPQLTLLPAGTLALEQRTTIAHSAALEELLDQLGERFDQLVLDVPAVLATSDAMPLVMLAEHCCLVVRQGVTSATQVRQALDDLSTAQMLGVVLNRVQLKTPAWIRRLIPQE